MKTVLLFVFIIISSEKAFSQEAKSAASDSLMITVFLKHQQDKSLSEIQKKQEENKLWDIFPPKQSRVVSWYVMMGIGQVVTLKITPKDLRTLNLSIEKGAWGAFRLNFIQRMTMFPSIKK